MPPHICPEEFIPFVTNAARIVSESLEHSNKLLCVERRKPCVGSRRMRFVVKLCEQRKCGFIHPENTISMPYRVPLVIRIFNAADVTHSCTCIAVIDGFRMEEISDHVETHRSDRAVRTGDA